MRPTTWILSLLLHGACAVALGCWAAGAGTRAPLVVAHCTVEPTRSAAEHSPERRAEVEPEAEQPEALPELPPLPEPELEAWHPRAPAPRAIPPLQLRPEPAEAAWRRRVVELHEPEAVEASLAAPALPFVPAAAIDEHNRPPEYPARAVSLRMQGTVLLDVTVAADGRVAAISIAQSSGHALLDRAAVRAVAEWRFRPAQQGGVALSDRLQIPVEFRLRLTRCQ